MDEALLKRASICCALCDRPRGYRCRCARARRWSCAPWSVSTAAACSSWRRVSTGWSRRPRCAGAAPPSAPCTSSGSRCRRCGCAGSAATSTSCVLVRPCPEGLSDPKTQVQQAHLLIQPFMGFVRDRLQLFNFNRLEIRKLHVCFSYYLDRY